jgi:hypothetical protein
MKKLLAICILCCAGSLPVKKQALFYAQPVVASSGGGGSCPADGSPNVSQTGTTAFIRVNSDAPYSGVLLTPGSNINLCKVRVNVTSQGTISAINFTVSVYAVSGTSIVPASPLGTTTAVSGNNSWSLSDVIFNFPSAIPLTSGATYAIVVTGNGGSGTTDYLQTYKNTSSASAGQARAWFSNGTVFDPGDGSGFVCALYWY